MTITVDIIEDSLSPYGPRLTTFQIRYPRFIHSEFMTHRQLSRSASSSRAVPVTRLIRQVIEDPAEPVEWGSNQRGMQAGDPLTGWRRKIVRRVWRSTRRVAVLGARIAVACNAHKQVVNRILEPWSHISVVVTATEWTNFFALRCHPDADPTFQALAYSMQDAYQSSEPIGLDPGQWHLPYVLDSERAKYGVPTLKKISAARCARVSYLNHDGQFSTLAQDHTLIGKLTGSPVHASPFEHQGTPDAMDPRGKRWIAPDLHGNFVGWIQHRKQVPNEAA